MSRYYMSDLTMIPCQIVSTKLVKKAMGCFVDQIKELFCNVSFINVGKTIFFDIGTVSKKDLITESIEAQVSVVLSDANTQTTLFFELFAINGTHVSSIMSTASSTLLGSSIQQLHLHVNYETQPGVRLIAVVHCGPKDSVGDISVSKNYQ
jgi:hypothetical protein